MTRILLTGATGRLGGVFLSTWENDPRFDVITLTREQCDLAEPEKLRATLRPLEFDVLVNPAAISGLEECLDHPAKATAINVNSPGIMAEVCREKSARFIHFSTDYVFAGREPGKKSENEPAAPVNRYGETKLAGEQAALAASPDAIIARVSWLFGPTPVGRPCHFDQVLAKACEGKPLELIHDKFSMPTFTPDVVAWTEALLENREAAGTYHLCNSGEPESWHSAAEKICQIAHRHNILPTQPSISALPISKAHFFRAQRPIHTAMHTTRLEDEGIATPRHWIEAAEEYMKIR